MKNGTLIPYRLPSITITAGATSSIPLKDIQKLIGGRFAHVVKITVVALPAPTYNPGAPTTVGNNNVFTSFDLNDGKMNRFVGGLNHIRAWERFFTGRNRVPDADTDLASTNARTVRRTLHMGPPHMLGAPSDFMVPAGYFVDGEISYVQGALTDYSADTTVISGTARVTAWLQGSDEMRIPPALQLTRVTANSSDMAIPGKALYAGIALLNSASFDAIGAGDFGQLQLDLGHGDVFKANAEDLAAGYADDFAQADVGGFMGEPENANDDNHKIVNRASPTAIAAGPNDLQPVLWTPPGGMISKLFLCDGNARLQWDGSQASGVILLARLLEQPDPVLASYAAKALKAVGRGVPKSIEPKTLSKREYKGTLKAYMPHVCKF